MLGSAVVTVNVTLSEIDARFWQGNRLYVELAWNDTKKPNAVQKRILDRLFLDTPEFVGKGTDKKVSSVGSIILWTVIAVIGYRILVLLADR